MLILPAIDLYDKKAVRLYKGDYEQMTVYSENPLEIAKDFEKNGATFVHLVDLEGAKNGTTPNIDVVRKIADYTSLDIEIGGGIRDEETIKKYLDLGIGKDDGADVSAVHDYVILSCHLALHFQKE